MSKDLVSDIMAYEQGAMDEDQIVHLFAELVKNGMAWQLQGHYGRTAIALMKAGKISQSGEVLARD